MPAIVLDSNLLLVLIAGLTSPAYIGRQRRLREYAQADFVLLQDVISAASKLIVTPNTLTETSNLIGYIREPARTRIYQKFRELVTVAEELYPQSREVVQAKEFVRLGLTDAALLEISETHILLTVDLDLYHAALKRGAKAENFNHLRELQGLLPQPCDLSDW